jgi:(4-(4-[2-(gamma-L-glutamylamino)ethyl]phenoxymethyl)furan-2-yl)methanamine synthase
MSPPPAVLGWDIGGVNTKVARLPAREDGSPLRTASLPYEIKRNPAALVATLRQAARSVGSQVGDLHAVTMTAELSQAFRTKREGVAFILDALEQAFDGNSLKVYSVDGTFVSPKTARELPLSVAAANWAATSAFIARMIPTCLLIDIGTTSTDLIPIVNGRVAAEGRSDPARLLSGELVYTGAVRTPVEAIAAEVPLWGGTAGIGADGFALIGDAHLWLGHIAPEDYSCATPDGVPPTRQSAGERLARVVCGDREMLDDTAVHDIAVSLVQAQVATVSRAVDRILPRWPAIDTVVVAGIGDFIAVNAATASRLRIVRLSDRLGEAARVAPAAAVAWLLRLNGEPAS